MIIAGELTKEQTELLFTHLPIGLGFSVADEEDVVRLLGRRRLLHLQPEADRPHPLRLSPQARPRRDRVAARRPEVGQEGRGRHDRARQERRGAHHLHGAAGRRRHLPRRPRDRGADRRSGACGGRRRSLRGKGQHLRLHSQCTTQARACRKPQSCRMIEGREREGTEAREERAGGSHRRPSSQRFYHGTKADLKPGDLIEPGHRPNFGKQEGRRPTST